MSLTPEGKVKTKIRKVLAKYRDSIYVVMNVPAGWGASTVDYVGCAGGLFFGIEAKRAGGKPTPRQAGMLEDIERAQGKTFVISDDAGLLELDAWLSRRIR